MRAVGVLLAAGASRRFGPENKLLAGMRGRALVSHAADALRAVPLAARLAVVADARVGALLPGYDLVVPDGGGQADSLRAGLAAAEAQGADMVLIVLGDMPGVTAELMTSVLARARADRPAAAWDGRRPLPPVALPRVLFAAARALSGDQGARALLAGLPPEALVPAAPDLLADVDVKADLATKNR